MSTTEEILNATFKKVGNDFGYETSAEYAAFRDLKVRWQRSYKPKSAECSTTVL
jgi:hypothetical protein